MREMEIKKAQKFRNKMKKLILGTLLLESLILPLSCNKKEEVKVETTQYLNLFSPMSHAVKQYDIKFDIIPFQLTEHFQKVSSSISVRQTKEVELFNSKNGNYYLMPNPYNRKYSAFYLNKSIFLMDIDIDRDKVVLFEFKQNNPKMYVLPLRQKNVESFGIQGNELYISSDVGTSIFLLDEKGLRSHDRGFKNYERYMEKYRFLKSKRFE